MAEKIPDDIFFNIFSRMPVEPLLQLKSVCKSWPDMIDDPSLASMHLTHTATKSQGAILLIDHPTKKKKLDSTRKPDSTLFRLLKEKDCSENLKFKTSLVADFVINPSTNCVLRNSCDGLLCFSAKSRVDRGETVFLCNPIRKEIVMLPRATMPSFLPSYGLGFDSKTSMYKIVHVFFEEYCRVGDDSFGKGGNVEVHTLGTNSWRKVSEKPPCPLSKRLVFANGALHWTPFPCFTDHHDVIVSFDIAKEVFYLTSHPQFQVNHLVDLGGVLAIVDLSSNMCVEIWLLKDISDGAKEWVKEYRINMKAPNGRVNNEQVEVVGMWENGEIFLRSPGGFFSYNPKTDRLRYMYIPVMGSETEVISFRGSLVSPSRLMVV